MVRQRQDDMEVGVLADVTVRRLKASAMELVNCQELIRAEEHAVHMYDSLRKQPLDPGLKSLVERGFDQHTEHLATLVQRLRRLGEESTDE